MNQRLLDFRRSLGLHLDAIRTRCIEGYLATLGEHEELLIALPHVQAPPQNDRSAILAEMRSWFSKRDWTFSPSVAWTTELGDTAFAMVNIVYAHSDRYGMPCDNRFPLMFVFRRYETEWRAIAACAPTEPALTVLARSAENCHREVVERLPERRAVSR